MLVLFVFFYSVQQGNIPEQKYLFQDKKEIICSAKNVIPSKKILFPV